MYDTFIVNGDLRTISIPASCNGILGVESDEKVAQIPFRIPRYYGDLDLTTFQPRVNYLNSNSEVGVSICTFSESNDEYAYFTWEVDRRATRYVGTTSFVVCLILTDEDGTIAREFNTTVQRLKVLEGIEAENELENEYTDIITYILNRLDEASLATTYTIEYDGEVGQLVLIGEDGSRSYATLPDSSVTLFRVSVDENDLTILSTEATNERELNIVSGEMVNLLFLGTTDVADEFLTLNVTHDDTTLTYYLYNQRRAAWPSVPEDTLLTAVCTGTGELQVISVPEGSDVADLRALVNNNKTRLDNLNAAYIQGVMPQLNTAKSDIESLKTRASNVAAYGDGYLVTMNSSSLSIKELFGNTEFDSSFSVTLSNGTLVYTTTVNISFSGAGFSERPTCIELTAQGSSGIQPIFAVVNSYGNASMTVNVISLAPFTGGTLFYHVVGKG